MTRLCSPLYQNFIIQVALDMKYTPTQTQAAVTSGMANLNLAPPPPTNAAVNVNPPPPMFAPQNFALNPGHMPLPVVSQLIILKTFSIFSYQ